MATILKKKKRKQNSVIQMDCKEMANEMLRLRSLRPSLHEFAYTKYISLLSLRFSQEAVFRKPCGRFKSSVANRQLLSTCAATRSAGLFYIKQYGNTWSARKMSNKDIPSLACYYAITYQPVPVSYPLRNVPCLLRSCARQRTRERKEEKRKEAEESMV